MASDSEAGKLGKHSLCCLQVRYRVRDRVRVRDMVSIRVRARVMVSRNCSGFRHWGQ